MPPECSGQGQVPGTIKSKPYYNRAYRSFGDFVKLVVENPSESKATGIQSGEAGGFLVPDQWTERLLLIDPLQSYIRSRALVLPPGKDFRCEGRGAGLSAIGQRLHGYELLCGAGRNGRDLARSKVRQH